MHILRSQGAAAVWVIHYWWHLGNRFAKHRFVNWAKAIFLLLALVPIAVRALECGTILARSIPGIEKFGHPEIVDLHIRIVEADVNRFADDLQQNSLLEAALGTITERGFPIGRYAITGTIKDQGHEYEFFGDEAFGFIGRVSEIRGVLDAQAIWSSDSEEPVQLAPAMNNENITSGAYELLVPRKHDSSIEGRLIIPSAEAFMYIDAVSRTGAIHVKSIKTPLAEYNASQFLFQWSIGN